MEALIRDYMAIVFLIVGLSHALHAELWRQMFLDLSNLPYAPFLIAIVTIPVGLVIVLGHNVWQCNPAVMITVFGWMMTVKGTMYALIPKAYTAVAKGSFESASPRQIAIFRVCCLAVSADCVWILLDG